MITGLPLGVAMIRFEVLGPIRWRTAQGEHGAELTLMLQRLLAVMLARAPQPVPADTLVDLLWPGEPPRTARKTVQIYVHRLRRLLGDDDRIVRTEAGYRLVVHPGEVDAEVFETLLARAAGERPESAERLLGEALALWRGPAYAGMHDLPEITAAATRLEERRLAAFEDHADAELTLGRPGVVARLTPATAANPYRERLHGLLMRALYREGRQAEALEVYRRTRQSLVDGLGVEPGADLQHLHQAMLRGDPALTGAKHAPAPRTLPHDVREFVGRQQDLAWLDDAAGIVTVTGPPGVGKTALALHWAHRAVPRFPDGQLYVNLCGYGPGAARGSLDALLYLLRCLGVPREDLPGDVEEASALYRSWLADRRVLIVLDNVSGTEQVRPLLPGGNACQVVITSRDRLSGVVAHDGARRLTLGLLPDDHGMALLRRLIGDDRVDAEPGWAARIVELCAGLPLALRIAAARLADWPGMKLSEYAAHLAEGGRLESLSLIGDEERAMRSVLDRSYETLPPRTRWALRMLGAVPGPDFTVPAVAALTGTGQAEAARILDTLAAAHLVEQSAPQRFSFHDLVREYACALSEQDSEREAALARLFAYFRDMTLIAKSHITANRPAVAAEPVPRLVTAAEAMEWLEAERAGIIALISAAASSGRLELAGQIAAPASGLLLHAGYTAQAVDMLEAAATAMADAETATRYRVVTALGNAYNRVGRQCEAIEVMRQSIRGREALGDEASAAGSRHNLANILRSLGSFDEALALEETALATARRLGDRDLERLILGSGLPSIYQKLGRWADAVDSLRQGLAMARESGSPFAVGLALSNLGWTCARMGDLGEAQRYLTEGLQLARLVGNRYGEPHFLAGLARVERDRGHHAEAIKLGLEAYEKMAVAGPIHLTELLNELGDSYRAAGMAQEARQRYGEAAALAEQRHERFEHERALAGLELVR